jgi:signal transduction histidine kinase
VNKKSDIGKNPDYARNGEKYPDLSSLDLPYPRSAGSNSMMSVIDRDYRYETVNLKFCKAHRKDQQFFTGNTLSAVWGNEVFSDFIKPNVDMCLMGKAVRYEAFFRIAESGLNLYEVFMYPLRYSKGQVTHIVAETLDISTVKRSQANTANIRQNQESFTEDLHGKPAQTKAMDTFRVFSGGIAHDLNNILTTIGGYAEMLATDLQNDPDCHEKTLRILSSVDKAKSITGQLLIIGKQAGFEKKDVDVLELLNETLDLIKPNLPHDVVIETDLQPDNARVFSDPSQIFRIFLNLITNAIQAMDKKGGVLSIKMSVIQGDTMEIKTSQKKDKSKYVIISFQDTGKGINPVVMKRIFEPFFSAGKERRGSGLGLSVVYELVNGMGGSIFVSSEEDIGSLFEIKLPMV